MTIEPYGKASLRFFSFGGIPMDKQVLVNTGAGFIGAIVSYAYGGWSEALSFLLLVIAIDIVTGMYASIKEGHGLSSTIGSSGLAKKGLMLLVILLAHRMDVLMETNVVMTGAVYFYIANELVSIVENYGRIGLPLPERVKSIIAILKGRADDAKQS